MEKKENYFVSDVCADLTMMRDHWAHLMPVRRKWFGMLGLVLVIVCCFHLAFSDPRLLKLSCGISLIVFGIIRLRQRDGGSKYRKYLEESGGAPRRNLCYIREEGIRYRNPESENIRDFACSDIRAITRTRMLFLLDMADGQQVAINHRTLTGGTPDELERWLLERSGVQKVRRPFDIRFLSRAITFVMAVGLAAGLFLDADYYGPQDPVSPIPGVNEAQVLEELGIEVPEEAFGEPIGEEYGFADLLFVAGMGEYDYDTFEWTPARSGVYAFDLEVFNVGAMYTDFLRGIEALSGGELTFTDIVEDDSGVDFESGTGWKRVTFRYDGKVRSFRPQMNYDWFDPAFANALAKLTEDPQTGKRLRFYFDGYQVAYVFWCDEDWAREFTRATGLRLRDEMA